MKKSYIFILSIALVVGVEFANDLFHPVRLPVSGVEDVWGQNKIGSDVSEIINQPFHYLGSGRQSFVFESADQKYVIKFFNDNYFCLPVKVREFFFPKKELKKRHKKELYFSGHALALLEFKEESGLIAIHAPNHFKQRILVQDKLGRLRAIDLKKVPFVLQRKMVLLADAFRRFQQNGRVKEGIDAVVDLFVKRAQLGIQDEDYNVVSNVGFIDDEAATLKATLLDPGRLFKDEKLIGKSFSRMEIINHLMSFEEFITKRYPDYLPYLKSEIQKAL